MSKKKRKPTNRSLRPRSEAEGHFLQQLGQRMKERRAELGLTASALAEKVGISPSTQYNRERGQTFFLEEAFRYLKPLKWNVTDFFRV